MSTTPKDPFAFWMAEAAKIAQAVNPGLEGFTPEAMEKLWPTMNAEMMEAFFGKTFNEGGLDAKTKLWLTLAGLVMQGAQNESALRLTVRHLAEAGASGQEIAEAIGLLAGFAGLPAAQKAAGLAETTLGKET